MARGSVNLVEFSSDARSAVARGGICEHGRQLRKCKECGGKVICEHGTRVGNGTLASSAVARRFVSPSISAGKLLRSVVAREFMSAKGSKAAAKSWVARGSVGMAGFGIVLRSAVARESASTVGNHRCANIVVVRGYVSTVRCNEFARIV